MEKCEIRCHHGENDHRIQPFPSSGKLKDNANLSLSELKLRVRADGNEAYSYIVRTVKLNQESTTFEQHGSAPNFQGDVLTLCTCKHQMRSRLSATEWQDDIWVTGFTSRTIHEDVHWLFFLAKIETAHDSHSELWDSMDADSRREKAAHAHYLGDIFKPKTSKPTGDGRFSPSRYVIPLPRHHVHRKNSGDNGWQHDIDYQHAVTLQRPPLLLANPDLTFLWQEPRIFFARKKHCRDYHKWFSIQKLMYQLR